MENGLKKSGYTSSLWTDTPATVEEFIKDPRFEKLSSLDKDAALAKYLHMSYGSLQAYKYREKLDW